MFTYFFIRKILIKNVFFFALVISIFVDFAFSSSAPAVGAAHFVFEVFLFFWQGAFLTSLCKVGTRAAAGQMGALSRIVLLCPLPQILWKLKKTKKLL